MGYRVGIDIGGTFTDLQLLEEETGQLTQGKVPSTPDDPAQGFVEGLQRLLESAGRAPEDVKLILHGTTIVTNSLLERRFAPTGLILTRGYRSLLEYARVNVPGAFGTWLFHRQPERIVPLENVKEITERTDRKGEIRVPLDEDEVEQLALWYKRQGIGSVGVSLLWSFANAHAERRIREIFATVYPSCDVALSSDILPEIGEYERAFTTALSAALRPPVGDYLKRVETLLDRDHLDGRLLCMKSSGGVVGARQASLHPVELALSGPAAGVLGMAEVCKALGIPKAITVDMGGTSTDISFIEEFRPLMSTDGTINDYPLRVPMIDIHTIGAGGGSIAWVSAGGKPQVGPRSAGANPGPAAYDRGGTEATVTDANLVLGRLPSSLLSGGMQLNPERARAAVERFGERIGLSVVSAALTIVELAVHSMDLGIREVSTRKGRDPRECVLIAFGGAGPGHAARLAELLEIPTVVLPHAPGVGSTFGLLSTDIRSDFVQSVLMPVGSGPLDDLRDAQAKLSDQAWARLDDEGVDEPNRAIEVSADLRYTRQQYTINVPIPRSGTSWNESLTTEELEGAVDRFHSAHRALCGFDYREDSAMHVDVVNLRVAGIGHLARPRMSELDEGDGEFERALIDHRPVFFEGLGAYVSTPIFARMRLARGDVIEGPAVIEEFDSTSLVLPSQTAEVDRFGNVILRLHATHEA